MRLISALILATFGLLAASVSSAHADELIRLPLPPAVVAIAGPAYAHCTAAGFNTDGSIHGACETVHASACSGRGCQPVRYVYDFVANWSLDGFVQSAIQCSVTRRHVPQPPVITYTPGYDASNCPAPVYNPTGTVVEIYGVPYFYVSTDSNGNELVNSNVAGFVYLPATVIVTPDYGKFE